MYTATTQLRIRYSETDQMGYAYYGNYAQYYEVARVEALRALGITYKALEEKGIIMPVLENWSKFIRPARYDDLITIKTYLKKPPSSRITFEYELFDQENTLLNIGKTTLVFLNAEQEKIIECPNFLQEKLASYFK